MAAMLSVCLDIYYISKMQLFFLEIIREYIYLTNKKTLLIDLSKQGHTIEKYIIYVCSFYPGLNRFDLKLLGFDPVLVVIVVKELFKENLGAGFGVLGLAEDNIGLA